MADSKSIFVQKGFWTTIITSVIAAIIISLITGSYVVTTKYYEWKGTVNTQLKQINNLSNTINQLQKNIESLSNRLSFIQGILKNDYGINANKLYEISKKKNYPVSKTIATYDSLKAMKKPQAENYLKAQQFTGHEIDMILQAKPSR